MAADAFRTMLTPAEADGDATGSPTRMTTPSPEMLEAARWAGFHDGRRVLQQHIAEHVAALDAAHRLFMMQWDALQPPSKPSEDTAEAAPSPARGRGSG